jgi:rhodanese-related sulfurtransferase
MSRVTAVPAADPATALAHHEARLALETDADDVGAALRDGAADFTLLDARSPAAHAAAHLPGARSLPHATIDAATVAALPPGPLVVYCWGPGCNAAHKAAAALARHGRTAKEMLGGFEYYVREGWPVEGERAAALRPDRTGLVAV